MRVCAEGEASLARAVVDTRLVGAVWGFQSRRVRTAYFAQWHQTGALKDLK
jgi:hypothetical protein